MEGTVQLNPLGSQWVDHRHADYARSTERALYARHHYTGEVVDQSLVQAYVRKRAIGEAAGAYEERCSLADYANHYAAVLDSIAGMLFAVEGDSNRVWNKPDATVLGDPGDPTTVAGLLWADADGAGTGLVSVWKSLAVELLVAQACWVVVNPGSGKPQVRLFPVEAVTNWFHDGEGMAAALVEEEVDARASIKDLPKRETRWLLFEREGWTRWRRNEQGLAVQVEGEDGQGAYKFVDRRGRRALPIYQARLPMRRHVGWQLAVKANRIFNLESSRDHLLRVANFPKLNLVASDEAFDKMVSDLAAGANALQVSPDQAGKAHHYIAPDAAPATIATEVLKRKVEEFYITAFRMYGDSAQEKTATEANQDVSQGVGAFLQLLKAAVDDAENEALWRVEQSVHPDRQELWWTARVERSDNFVPTDVEKAIDKLKERFFGAGETIPVGRAALVAAAEQVCQWSGVAVDRVELESAVDARLLARGLADLKAAGGATPAGVTELAIAVLQEAGLVSKADGDRAGLNGPALAQKVAGDIADAAKAEAEAKKAKAAPPAK